MKGGITPRPVFWLKVDSQLLWYESARCPAKETAPGTQKSLFSLEELAKSHFITSR